jgi:hypothetical protein
MEAPVNSTPSKDNVPGDGPTGRADEQLAHAHEQIVQADEQLTRLSEQLAKLERDDVRPPPAEPSPQPQPAQSSATPPPATPSPPAKPALAVPVGLMLAAGIVVVALVWQSSYGGGVRPSPQLASAPSLPPANPSAQPIPSTVQLASVEAVPPQVAPPPSPAPPAPILAQAAPPQEARPATAASPPSDQTQLLQTMARDLANLERNIEQLRTNQQQMASDNAKAIGELKASQDEMKRALAKVPDQAPPRASSLPVPPATALRKPERPRSQVRARPRYPYPREWLYDDW